MIRLSILLIALVFCFKIAFAEEPATTDKDWEKVKMTIKEIEKDLETEEKIRKNIESMNKYITEGLKVLNKEGVPKAVFEVDDNKLLIMGIREDTHLPYSKVVLKSSASKEVEVETKSNLSNTYPSGLPKIFFALSSILYVIFSAYFLFMAGYNIKNGNIYYVIFDLMVWAIATALMYEMFINLKVG